MERTNQNIYSVTALGNTSFDSSYSNDENLISDFHKSINKLKDRLSIHNQGHLRREDLRNYIEQIKSDNNLVVNPMFNYTLGIFDLLIESYQDTDLFLKKMQTWPSLFNLSMKHTQDMQLQQKMQQQEKQQKIQQQEKQAYEAEIQQLHKEVYKKNAEIASINTQFLQLEEQKLKFEKEVKQKQTSLMSGNEKIQEILREKEADIQNKEADILDKENRIQNFEKQITNLNLEMNTNIENKDKIIQRITQEMKRTEEENSKRITQLNTQNTQLNSKFQKLQDENKEQQKYLEEREKYISQLNTQNTQLNSKFQTLQDENKEQQKYLEEREASALRKDQEKEREISNLKSELSQRDLKLHHINEELIICTQDLSTREKDLHYQLQIKNGEIETLTKTKNEEMNKQYEDHTSLLQQIQQEYEKNKTDAANENTQLRTLLNHEQQQCEKTTQELNHERQQYEKIKRELNQEQQQHEYTKQDLKKCLDNLQIANNQMEVDNGHLHEENRKMAINLQNCEENLKKCHQHCDQQRNEYIAVINKLNAEQKILMTENAKLVVEKERLEQQSVSIRNDWKQALQEVEQIREEVNRQNQENKTLREKILEDRSNFEKEFEKITKHIFPTLKNEIQPSSSYDVILSILHKFIIDHIKNAREKHAELNNENSKWTNSINILFKHLSLKFDVENLTYEIICSKIMEDYREKVWSLTSPLASSSLVNTDYDKTTKQIQEYYYDKFKLQMKRVAYCIRQLFLQIKMQRTNFDNVMDVTQNIYAKLNRLSPHSVETTIEELREILRKTKEEKPLSWQLSARLIESDTPYMIDSTSNLNITGTGTNNDDKFFKIAYPDFSIKRKDIVNILMEKIKDTNLKQREKERKRDRKSDIEVRRFQSSTKRALDAVAVKKKNKSQKKEDKKMLTQVTDDNINKEESLVEMVSPVSPSATVAIVPPLTTTTTTTT